MSDITGDSENMQDEDETMPELPELLEVLDVDALPDAFSTRERVLVKVAGKQRLVNLSTDGMDDVSRAWRRKNPRPLPPYTEKQVPEGSSLALRLGHTKGLGIVKVYDEKEPSYEQLVEEHSIRHNLVIVAHCLKFELRKNGQTIEGLEERGKELERLGMTSTMAAQLVGVLTRMMMVEITEAVRFFGDASASGG